MKTLLVLLAALTLSACAKKDREPDLVFSGSENRFTQIEKRAFGGVEAIENSFVSIGGKFYSFFDPNATGEMRRRDMETGETKSVLPNGARFSYVIEENGELINFVTINGNIYRSRSTDHGLTWVDSQKVVDAQMVQWNPGVVKGLNGHWHMLIEADQTGLPNQAGVACYYFTSLDTITWVAQGKAINGCGNPSLVATSRGLLVFHGDLSAGTWFTTVSTFDGSEWVTHRDKFLVSSPGVHVCDPSVIERDGKIVLSVSVDQNSITLTEANDTFESLHERLVR